MFNQVEKIISRIFKKPGLFVSSAVLAFLAFFASQLWAWNSDYAYGPPQQRRLCVKRIAENRLRFSTISEEEDCSSGSQRYIAVFSPRPEEGIGLIPSASSARFYPPLTASWPQNKEQSIAKLWHFTCVKRESIEMLKSEVELMRYRGEITADGKNYCESVRLEALRFCQDEWKGEELLEACPDTW